MTKPTPTFTESKHVWPAIKAALPRAYRIETGTTANGIPDVLYARPGYHGFIEMKIAKWRTDGTMSIRFRPGQVDWLVEHDKLAGHVWLMFATAAGVLWLVPGVDVPAVAIPFGVSTLSTVGLHVGTVSNPDIPRLLRFL